MNKKNQNVFPLHCLHSLIAASTRGNDDLYKAIESAIDFSLETGDIPETSALKSSADKILSLYRPTSKDCVIEHCHLDLPIYAPLWHRAALIHALSNLAGAKQGILIITGLKQSILAQGHRWSASAKQKHAEAIAYSEAIAAQFSPTSESLHLLFL